MLKLWSHWKQNLRINYLYLVSCRLCLWKRYQSHYSCLIKKNIAVGSHSFMISMHVSWTKFLSDRCWSSLKTRRWKEQNWLKINCKIRLNKGMMLGRTSNSLCLTESGKIFLPWALPWWTNQQVPCGGHASLSLMSLDQFHRQLKVV